MPPPSLFLINSVYLLVSMFCCFAVSQEDYPQSLMVVWATFPNPATVQASQRPLNPTLFTYASGSCKWKSRKKRACICSWISNSCIFGGYLLCCQVGWRRAWPRITELVCGGSEEQLSSLPVHESVWPQITART